MKLQQKLIVLLLIIGLLPTLVVSTVAYVTISRQLNAKTNNQLASIAIKQQQKINSILQSDQEEVVKLANQYDFQVTLARLMASRSQADRDALISILRDKQSSTSVIQSVSVSDLPGRVVASTVDGVQGTQLMAEDVPMSAGPDTVITVHQDPQDSINKLYITSQISINKQPLALLSVVVRLDEIVAALQDYTGLGTTGETLLTTEDAHGHAISLFPLRFDVNAALKTNLDNLHLFTFSQLPYNQGVDYRGHRVIVISRPVGFAEQWAIATKIDDAEASAPITQLGQALLAIVVVSSLAIVCIALYLARRFTEPIVRITRASERIGRGDFLARVNLARTDEIGVLGASINAMGTSLRQFVANIETQRNRLEAILNSTAESILAIDKDGTILIANQPAAELAGRPIERVIGQPIDIIFSFTQSTQPYRPDYHATGTHTYNDLQYADSNGQVHYIKLIVARPKPQAEHQPAQSIVTIHDETKSRELENMKVDFVSMAAHELRTPLAAARGYLELVAYKAKLSADEDKYLDQALRSTAELGGLIDNLLDITRIERGAFNLSLEKVDLVLDVRQAVRRAQFGAIDKRLSLTCKGPDSGYFVVADHMALGEVLDNLLSNAVKYTSAGGSITVDIEQRDAQYLIRVADTGIGIPKSALPNLFTKFYRVRGGLSSGSTGTGLGLFIAKSIVERLKGTIDVTSEEGVGSTFTVALPVYRREHLAQLIAQQPSTEEPSTGYPLTQNLSDEAGAL